jgi:hypothetical protein
VVELRPITCRDGGIKSVHVDMENFSNRHILLAMPCSGGGKGSQKRRTCPFFC